MLLLNNIFKSLNVTEASEITCFNLQLANTLSGLIVDKIFL